MGVESPWVSAILILDSGMKLEGEHRPQGVDNIQISVNVRVVVRDGQKLAQIRRHLHALRDLLPLHETSG